MNANSSTRLGGTRIAWAFSAVLIWRSAAVTKLQPQCFRKEEALGSGRRAAAGRDDTAAIRRKRRIADAFSLIELLVVIAIVALLASLLLPVLSKARSASQAAVCRSNLKQLGVACAIYINDNQQCFPPPLRHKPWVLSLRSCGLESKILKCPADKSGISSSASSALIGTNLLLEPRSFLMNGFTDWIKTVAGDESYNAFRKGFLETGLKESALQFPTSTIIFGEKASNNPAFYLDLFKQNGLYFRDLSESRHGSGANSTAGNANYAMGDGHVAVYPYGKGTCPENLWAVLPAWRSDAALCRPR